MIDYLIMFLECFVWWRLMDSVLEAKYHKKYTAYAAVGLMILMFTKISVIHLTKTAGFSSFGTLILMVYSMTCVILLFRNSFIEKLIWWAVYNFGLFIIEVVTMLIIHLVMNQSLDTILSDQISKYIIFLGKVMMLPLFEFIIRRRKENLVIGMVYYKELSALIFLNAILLIFMVYILSNKRSLVNDIDKVILFVFGLVLFITIYTVILIFRLERKSKEELATQLKLQETELELKLNEDMVNITDKLRKLRHDMNNHIGLIKTLVHTERYDELEEYINQIYEDVEIANELVISGNRTVAVLINAKKALAKSKNIEFSSMITILDLNMQSKDICTLLGNILDNAIEAAEKSLGKKYIDLMIQKTEEGCVISCENSIGTRPVVKKGKFVTWKDNTFNHGIGTENMKDIVTKYKGQLYFDYDDEAFNVRVDMPV
jgi:hypothetical protein